jgi:BolA family transcriptional regulator, general stress-responsive regulator
LDRRNHLESTLREAFAPVHLLVEDESHSHSVPDGAQSHFRVVLVSPMFEGMPLIERQRRVNQALAAEFQAGLHALALHTWTPRQWFERGGDAPISPPCLGGSKVG